MVIQLSPTLEESIAREAKQEGKLPEQLIQEMFETHLALKRQPREQVSEARRQLDELLKHKKKTVDFDAEVHAAKREAGRLLEDNAEWIESAIHRFDSDKD